MKVTCIHGATMRIVLVPETPLEKLQLSEMAEKSEKGIKTVMTCVDGAGASQFNVEVG